MISGYAAEAFKMPFVAVNVLNGTVPHNIFSQPLFDLFGQKTYFTSHILMLLLSAGLMLTIFPYMARKLETDPVPTGARNFFEAMLVFLKQETFDPMLGKWSDVFTPYLWTAFFFILFANLLGMIPVDEIVQIINRGFGLHIPEFWGGATGDLTVTATLAICTFLTVHVTGIGEFIRNARYPHQHAGHKHDQHGADSATQGHGAQPERSLPVAIVVGFVKYLAHLVPPGVPLVLWPLMFVLELMGTFVKPLALCMRLFAVMMSGPLVVAVLVSIVFALGGILIRGVAGPPVILFGTAFETLHLLEAFLQAYIFTLLSAAYIAEAVATEH